MTARQVAVCLVAIVLALVANALWAANVNSETGEPVHAVTAR